MDEALDASIFTHFKFILVAPWTDPADGQGNIPLSKQNLQSANKAGQDHGPEHHFFYFYFFFFLEFSNSW